MSARLVAVLAIGVLAVGCDPEDEGGGGGVGGRIAYERDGNIWVAKDDGTGEKQLTTDGKGKYPAIAPNGLTVAFEREGEIWSVPSAGGAPAKLAGGAPGQSFHKPFWASSTIVFEILEGGQTRVGKMTENGEGIADVAAAPALWPTLDKNATQVLLVYGGSPQSLGTVPIAGGSPTTLPSINVTFQPDDAPKRAVFSPDGTKIAYTSFVSGKYKIFVADASGAGARQVQGSNEDDLWPAFSPDGSLLAFHSAEGGQEGIYQVPVDGSKPFELVIAGAKNASWGP